MDMARDILVLLFIIASAAKTADAVSTTDASTTAEATTEALNTTTYPPTTTTTEVATTTTTNASTTNNSSTEETTTSSAQVLTNTPTDSSSTTTTTTTTTTKTSTEETTSSPTDAEITSTTTNLSTPTITTVSTTTGLNDSQTSTIDSSSSTQSLPTSTPGATTDSTTTENSTTLLTTSTPHGNRTTLSITVASTASGAPTLSSSSTTNGSTSSTTSLTTVDTTTTDNASSTSSSGTSSSKTTVPSGATSTPTPSSEFTSSQTTESSTTSTNTHTGITTTVLSTVTSSESSSEPTTTPTTKATVIPTTASSSTAGTAKPGFSTVAPNKNAVFSLTLTVAIPNNQTVTIDVIKELENAFKNVEGFLRVEKDNSDSQTRRKRAAIENGAQSQSHFSVSFDANQNVNETEVENAIDMFNQSTNYKLTETTMSTFARQIGDRCLIDDFCRNGFICLDKGKCYSKCASPDRECQNEGTCFVSVNETVTKTLCRCKTEEFYRYEGEHCENKVMKWELAVAITAGSGGALVIILLFIIIILCAKRSSDSKYKHIKNSGGSSGAYANDAELNVYRPRQSTKYKESGLDQVDLQPGYDNKAYDFDSLPDSDSQGNSSFLHSSSSKRWDPDASSETYAKIYRQLEDTNYQVGIKRPQVSTRRNEVLTGF